MGKAALDKNPNCSASFLNNPYEGSANVLCIITGFLLIKAFAVGESLYGPSILTFSKTVFWYSEASLEEA